MAASNTVSKDIKDLLVTASVGTFGPFPSGWSIFIGKEPDQPSNTITIYDSPGDPPHPRWLLDYPRFQVRVRCLEYDTGFQKAEEVKSVLLGLPSQDVGGTRYVGIWVVLDTFFLMTDDKERSIFVNSWRSIREPNTGANRDPL